MHSAVAYVALALTGLKVQAIIPELIFSDQGPNMSDMSKGS